MTKVNENNIDNVTQQIGNTLLLPQRIILGLSLVFAGISLLFLVGFVDGADGFLHDAAHDTRHAATFPCH